MNNLIRSINFMLVAIGALILVQAAQAQTSPKPPPPAEAAASTQIGQQDAVAAAPMVVQLPPNPIEIRNVGSGGFLPLLAPFLISLVTAAATLLAVHITNERNAKNTKVTLEATTRNAQAATNQRANELEIASLDERLSGFFGPFLQLSEENKRLHQLLIERQEDPAFRTLTALIDPSWTEKASTTDRTLAKQLVENGFRLRELIRDQGGPASPTLLSWLSKASAHFTVLHLAHDGKLTDEPGQFLEYVYPRELDEILKLECDRLDRRRNALRADLATHHDPIEKLVVPSHLVPEPEPGPHEGNV